MYSVRVAAVGVDREQDVPATTGRSPAPAFWYPFLKDEVWFDAVRPYFAGPMIVGRDLMEI